MSSTIRLTYHETKPMPHPIPDTKIVAAYGLRKCPKLVEQISGSDLQVRINALSVACDELLNPYSVYSCVESGIVSVLASMVSDKDFTTREKASKCLAVLAQDSNGLEAIIREEVVVEILLGRQDPTEQVRGNVYECLLHVSRTIEGADACSAAGTTAVLVDALRTESLSLKSTILQYLYNVSSTLSGLMDAIESGAIQIIIELLDCENSDIRGNAAKTLGFICFDESGKKVALKDGAILKLLDNLVHPNFVLSNVLFALMAITSTDEGKRQCGILTEDNRLDKVIQLLTHVDRVVVLNTMKFITNIAVYPPLRRALLTHDNCITILNSINESDDYFLKKHAAITINAVNWKP